MMHNAERVHICHRMIRRSPALVRVIEDLVHNQLCHNANDIRARQTNRTQKHNGSNFHVTCAAVSNHRTHRTCRMEPRISGIVVHLPV